MHGPKESDQLQQCDDAYVLLNHSADVYVDMLNDELSQATERKARGRGGRRQPRQRGSVIRLRQERRDDACGVRSGWWRRGVDHEVTPKRGCRRRGEDGADAPCPDRSRNRDDIEREVEQSRKRGREEARSSGTGGEGARHGGGAIGGAAAAVKAAAAAAAVWVLGFGSGSDRNLA